MGKAMTTHTPPTVEQLIYNKIAGKLSDITLDMLVGVVLDFERNNQPLKEVVAQIALVAAGKESVLGTQFEERVQEALSFTKEDGGSVFDSDYDR